MNNSFKEYDLKNTNWENIKKGAYKYLLIMQSVENLNVQTDKDFQKLFNGFYRIRQRSKEFYESLYYYLEQNKSKDTSFEQTLAFFFEKLKRLEPSFSSKIVATINPNLPVWDSEVLKRLNIKISSYSQDKETRFKQLVKIYDDIVNWYSEFMNTEQAKNMINTFNEKVGNLNISNIKKIDLVLWQTRS